MKKLLTFALFLVAATSLTVRAHEGHAHKVMGRVVSITAEQIEVSNPAGKKETFALAKDAVYKRDKATASKKDVAVGTRVVLSIVEKDGKTSVAEVLIGVASGPAPARK